MSDTTEKLRGLKNLLQDAVEHGSRQVERVHRDLVDVPFALVERVPAVAAHAKAIHDAERVISGLSFDAVRLAARLVGEAAELALGRK